MGFSICLSHFMMHLNVFCAYMYLIELTGLQCTIDKFEVKLKKNIFILEVLGAKIKTIKR